MIRKIKFRAWDEQERFWIPDGEFVILSDGRVSVLEYMNRDNWLVDGPIKLMQYTGLKDGNGIEIYEGDWLEDNFGNGYLVEWSGIGWDPFCSNLNDAHDSIRYKVVGNLYEKEEEKCQQ